MNVPHHPPFEPNCKVRIVGSCMAVIDAEDREQVERLAEELYVQYLILDGALPPGNPVDPQYKVAMAARVQAALRSLIAPPKPRWTDGDVVQHVDGNYTAQRHDGEWRTTTSGKKWGGDEYVTNHVEAGLLTVLREQGATA